MKALMHRFTLHNDDIREASDKLLSPGQVGLLSGWGVFSTIKVIDGVLFAFERHWARMSRDAALMRVPLSGDAARLEHSLLRLVEKNRAFLSTMRVVVVRNRGGMWEAPDQTRSSDIIAFTADIKQWGGSVKLKYVRQARHAASMFAGTKILAWAMNLTWLEEAQSQGFDEVVLLNER
jgi:branched-chain amino acid aminotransferase